MAGRPQPKRRSPAQSAASSATIDNARNGKRSYFSVARTGAWPDGFLKQYQQNVEDVVLHHTDRESIFHDHSGFALGRAASVHNIERHHPTLRGTKRLSPALFAHSCTSRSAGSRSSTQRPPSSPHRSRAWRSNHQSSETANGDLTAASGEVRQKTATSVGQLVARFLNCECSLVSIIHSTASSVVVTALPRETSGVRAAARGNCAMGCR